MEYYKKVKEMIDMDATDFFGGVSEEEIEHAKQLLSVALPESYKAFLMDFGGGDIGGEIIFGITDDKEENVVTATQSERSQGLPETMVLIGFWNDTLICLDTSRMYNGECPVVEVDCSYDKVAVADTFGKFLYDYLKDE